MLTFLFNRFFQILMSVEQEHYTIICSESEMKNYNPFPHYTEGFPFPNLSPSLTLNYYQSFVHTVSANSSVKSHCYFHWKSLLQCPWNKKSVYCT